MPILILTANDTLERRITALNAGADDYLPKPFEVTELEARLRALVRRTGGARGVKSSSDRSASTRTPSSFSLSGLPLHLLPREHTLLETLLRNVGTTLSKASLLESLYGFDDEADLSAIELYVHRLRRKLEGSEVTIVTLRGLGYLLRLTGQ